MAHNSYASSGTSPTSPTSPERHPHITEHFPILPATCSSVSHMRLQQTRRRLSIRDSDIFVSTAIAPTKLVAATASEIRLYDLENRNSAQGINRCVILRPKLQPKTESIRAVAISEDLLAVVTHLRLIVYNHRDNETIEKDVVREVLINQRAAWTPRSVSIQQVNSADTHRSAVAWVAVGGEGVNGVKLFQFSRTEIWNPLLGCPLTLKCPQNTGLVRSVGFSNFFRRNSFIVFAVTTENRVMCWHVHSCDIGNPILLSRTDYDANATQVTSPHRGGITAVNVFESPSGMLYIFVATDQKPGSQLVRSFIAPLGTKNPQWKPLPDKVVGRQLFAAAATSSGRFLLVIDGNIMKLLTLHGAFEGGLRSLEKPLRWPSPLKNTAKEVSAISLSVTERLDHIEITGADGRGHLMFVRVNVPGLPQLPPPILLRPPVEAAELHTDSLIREICGEEVRRPPRMHATGQSEWDRVSEKLEIMLYK